MFASLLYINFVPMSTYNFQNSYFIKFCDQVDDSLLLFVQYVGFHAPDKANGNWKQRTTQYWKYILEYLLISM